MAERSEPNAQNSELKPKKHPSGARIEKMFEKNELEREPRMGPERGVYGELLRPSERENRYISPEDPAEGAREDFPRAPHRMDADYRERR